MSKKHYIAIARDLNIDWNRLEGKKQQEGFTIAVDTLMRAFKLDNHRFDKEKFYRAVYVDKLS